MTNEINAAERLCGLVAGALDDRLCSFIVYGSAATGDILPRYSDLDLLILLRGQVTFDDAMDLHSQVVGLDLAPYAYVQPTFVLEAKVSPLLVAGTFVVLSGSDPPLGAIQSEDDLRRNGTKWLAELPSLVSRDAGDWALAAVDVHRRARLALTRLKPAIRALLVREGGTPGDVWAMTWDAMLSRVADVDDQVHHQTSEAIAAARSAARGPDDVGTSAMLALRRICDLQTNEPSMQPLTISN